MTGDRRFDPEAAPPDAERVGFGLFWQRPRLLWERLWEWGGYADEEGTHPRGGLYVCVDPGCLMAGVQYVRTFEQEGPWVGFRREGEDHEDFEAGSYRRTGWRTLRVKVPFVRVQLRVDTAATREEVTEWARAVAKRAVEEVRRG